MAIVLTYLELKAVYWVQRKNASITLILVDLHVHQQY